MSCSSIRSRVCWAFRRPREVIKQLHRVMAPHGGEVPAVGGDQHLGGFQRDGGGERVGQSDDLAARPVEVGYDVIGGAGVPGIGDDQQAVLGWTSLSAVGRSLVEVVSRWTLSHICWSMKAR